MNENCRLNCGIRGVSPCKDCTERFLACSDRCPKDERGDFGHKAWKAELNRVKKERTAFLREWAQQYKSLCGGNDNERKDF